MYRYIFLLITFAAIQNLQSQSSFFTKSKVFSPKYYLISGEPLYTSSGVINMLKEPRINFFQEEGDSIFVYLADHEKDIRQDSSLRMIKEETLRGQYPYLLTGQGRVAHLKFKDYDTQLLTIPIKIRPRLDDAPLQFIGDVALGSYFGYQFGRVAISDNSTETFSQTVALFAAPGMVKIDPTVADTDSSNLTLGFSLGCGYLVNFNNYQIGLVGGIDYVSGDVSSSWIYQGKSWFSFTIGFDFNDEEKN